MLEADEFIDPRPLLGEFKSDLQFPRYRAATCGAWQIRAVAMLSARGYWGEVYRIAGAVVMLGPEERGSRSWMSMLPAEIESQEIGLRASRGHTVVFGLGMGWLAANVALRDEVERVSVVERDPDVIALVRASRVLEQLPPAARRKITVHNADALAWRPEGAVDTLQADIWRTLVAPGKLEAVRRMQANVGAQSLYFWGQELEIWRQACRRAGGPPAALDWTELRSIVDRELGLPLILSESAQYPAQIAQAAALWAPAQTGWWQ